MVGPPIAPAKPLQHEPHDEASELSSITHEYRMLHPPTRPEEEEDDHHHPSSSEEAFEDEIPVGEPPLPTEVLLPREKLSVVGISRSDYDGSAAAAALTIVQPVRCAFCRSLLPPWMRRAPPWLQLIVLICFCVFMLSAFFIFASMAWKLQGDNEDGSSNDGDSQSRGIELPTTPTVAPGWYIRSAQTSAPSLLPTSKPSTVPSQQPTGTPTLLPSATPTAKPSGLPSSTPSSFPSLMPSLEPSSSRNATSIELFNNNITLAPKAVNVTQSPSRVPSASPSQTPTTTPTARPSRVPSIAPTSLPSAQPSRVPMGMMGGMMGTVGGTMGMMASTASSSSTASMASTGSSTAASTSTTNAARQSVAWWQAEARPSNFPTFAPAQR